MAFASVAIPCGSPSGGLSDALQRSRDGGRRCRLSARDAVGAPHGPKACRHGMLPPMPAFVRCDVLTSCIQSSSPPAVAQGRPLCLCVSTGWSPGDHLRCLFLHQLIRGIASLAVHYAPHACDDHAEAHPQCTCSVSWPVTVELNFARGFAACLGCCVTATAWRIPVQPYGHLWSTAATASLRDAR